MNTIQPDLNVQNVQNVKMFKMFKCLKCSNVQNVQNVHRCNFRLTCPNKFIIGHHMYCFVFIFQNTCNYSS